MSRELGWVRLSEGTLEHLLDHLVERRRQLGFMEWRELADVATALSDIKQHWIEKYADKAEEELSPWDWQEESSVSEPKEATAEYVLKDKRTGEKIEDLAAWMKAQPEFKPEEDSATGSEVAVAGLDMAEGSSESVEVLITGQGPVAPELEKPEPEPEKAKESREERRRKEQHLRTLRNRQMAEEAGVTLTDLTLALAEHGQDAMRSFLQVSPATAGNMAAMSQRYGYPVPTLLPWLVHLKNEAAKAKQPKAVDPDERLAPMIPWARARHCCYERTWIAPAERRMVTAWMESGMLSIEAFLKETYETDEYGVRVP